MKKFAVHIVIVVFGLIYGYFIWQSFYGHVSPSYPLFWNGAQWITANTPSPIGLFRKELFLSNKIINGWIQISAPDTYVLTINGKKVVENTFYSSNVSGIHDITNYLQPGRNVVAVSVRRLSFPGPSKVVVTGAYTDIAGTEIGFFSDSIWKVLTHEDSMGSVPWTSPLFDASSWPSAKIIGQPEPGETYPVTISPRAITSTPDASWIQHPSPFPEQANFRKDFALPQKPLDAWVRIPANTDYDLMINGTKVGSGNLDNALDIYAIASLLRKGDNTIEISIKNPHHITYALYLDGEIRGEDFNRTISTGPDWKAYLPHKNFQFERPFVLGGYSSYQFTNRPKVIRQLTLPFDYEVKRFFVTLCVIGLTIFFAYALTILTSKVICYFLKFSFRDYFSIASFNLIIPTILLLCLFILQFDIRIEQRDIFTPDVVYGTLFFILLLQVVVAATVRHSGKRKFINKNAPPQTYKKWKRPLIAITVLGLIVSGAFIRLNNLGYISLNGDEIGTLRYAQGILDKGYPFITIGKIEKPATTYELLSYPVAASIGILGINEASVRLPSALFGIATIFLVFWVGMKLINVRTGLLAAAIFTFMPLEINLAQNARYIALSQFYTLSCCYFFYKAFEEREVNKLAVYLTALFFVLGYLTWEGSGYLLPALLIATFFVKKSDFSWMKNWHLWLASIGACLVVLIQIAHRTYWSAPYMILGSGLSETALRLMFLTQEYNPWFYVNNLLLTQSNIVLSLLTAIGLPIILKKRESRYLFVVFFSILFLLSNTFAQYAARYGYFIQPLLIILGSAVVVELTERAYNLVKEFRVPILNALRYAILFMFYILILTVTNDYILKLYRLSSNPAPTENTQHLNLRSIMEMRRGIYPVDFRSANTFVKDNLYDGDIVVTVYSHSTLFYAGKVDYFEETIIDTQLVYFDDNDYPRLANKTVDIPTITSLSEFRSLLSRYKRVWFVASSFELFHFLNEKDFTSYVIQTLKPVYESYRTRVYLWENGKI